MRKSLVCDLMEPLRPIIDLAVRKGINLGQIKEDDFHTENGRYVLSWDRSRSYTHLFLNELLKRKGDMFVYIQSYYRMFMKGGNASIFKEFEL